MELIDEMNWNFFDLPPLISIIMGITLFVALIFFVSYHTAILAGNKRLLQMWKYIFKSLGLENYFNKRIEKRLKLLSSAYKSMGEHYEKLLKELLNNN